MRISLRKRSLVTALFSRAHDSIKREIASARTTATTSAIVYPARNSVQKSKQRVAHYPAGDCARRDNRTAVSIAPAANPKQMSLSFRAAHVSGVSTWTAICRPARCGYAEMYVSGEIGDVGDAIYASGSSDKARSAANWRVTDRLSGRNLRD